MPLASGSSVACWSGPSEHAKRRPHDPHLNVLRLADGRKRIIAQVCPDVVAIDTMSNAACEMRPRLSNAVVPSPRNRQDVAAVNLIFKIYRGTIPHKL